MWETLHAIFNFDIVVEMESAEGYHRGFCQKCFTLFISIFLIAMQTPGGELQ
jgi:hypothetical protein